MTKRRPAADLTPFGQWLMQQLDTRAMTRTDLARATGSTSGMVSKWLYRNNPLTPACERIAAALLIPLDDVLEAAGHRQVAAIDSAIRREALNLLQRLPEPLLVPLIPMLRGLIAQRGPTLDRLKHAIEPHE